jgi:hypothetical protein
VPLHLQHFSPFVLGQFFQGADLAEAGKKCCPIHGSSPFWPSANRGKREYSSPVPNDKRVVKEGFFRTVQLSRPPRVSGRRGIGWPICHELAAG